MAQAEGLLGGGIETLQRARDLMINARNGIMDDQNRETFATQLEQYQLELMDVANQRGQDGHFVFGGEGSARAPFPARDNTPFQGEQGIRQNGITISYDLNVDGSRVMQGFGADGSGTILGELNKVIKALRD